MTTTPRTPTPPADIHDIAVTKLDGTHTTLGEFRGDVLLVVNVASACGLTPQYAGLQRLHEKYAPRGLRVLGFPCNQFGAQEPGDAEQISSFCSLNYGVGFPMFAKIEVNGEGRHPLYQVLTEVPDSDGRDGDITWNFEKFVVSPSGEVLARFAPQVEPEDARVTALIESNLAPG